MEGDEGMRSSVVLAAQADDDREAGGTPGRLLAAPAEQHARPLPVLPHPQRQLPAAGERAFLQHLLLAALV